MKNANHSTKIAPARQVAFQILWRVITEQAFATNLLASNLTSKLSPSDRSLTQEIVLGSLRQERFLDYFLEKVGNLKLNKLDKEILIILRLGFYQLHFLSRVPDYAVVNDCVNLTKISGKASASRLVNAVLRKLTKLEIKEKFSCQDTAEEIAINHSHPTWLIKNWANHYGLTIAESIAESNNKPNPICFRVNNLKATTSQILELLKRNNIVIKPSSLLETAFCLVEGDTEILLKLANEGKIYLQDAASQLIAYLVAPKKGMRIFDACAAPGGKTTAIASLMENQGLIIAGDLHLARVKLIQQTAKKLEVKIIKPICYDATQAIPFTKNLLFDRVLVDAPCSGTGTLRHNPEIKWRLLPKKLEELSKLQLAILSNCAELVKPKGRLIYSTCSLEYEENEQVIEEFLSKNKDFQLIRAEVSTHLITKEGFIRTFPYRDNTEGFFAALLEKAN
jgi:16S rRNA (cytosine967-C5)-methyltransferase